MEIKYGDTPYIYWEHYESDHAATNGSCSLELMMHGKDNQFEGRPAFVIPSRVRNGKRFSFFPIREKYYSHFCIPIPYGLLGRRSKAGAIDCGNIGNLSHDFFVKSQDGRLKCRKNISKKGNKIKLLLDRLYQQITYTSGEKYSVGRLVKVRFSKPTFCLIIANKVFSKKITVLQIDSYKDGDEKHNELCKVLDPSITNLDEKVTVHFCLVRTIMKERIMPHVTGVLNKEIINDVICGFSKMLDYYRGEYEIKNK